MKTGLYIQSLQSYTNPTIVIKMNMYLFTFQLDYLSYSTKNHSLHLHNKLTHEMRETEKRNLKKFADLFKNSDKSASIIHLNNDYFGRIRGEIISVMKCPKYSYMVVSQRQNCSAEESHLKNCLCMVI